LSDKGCIGQRNQALGLILQCNLKFVAMREVWQTARMQMAPPNPSPAADSNDGAAVHQDADSGVSTSSGLATVREFGGREGPEPTRFGDWERAGRCIDF
jgi:hypothetical protein